MKNFLLVLFALLLFGCTKQTYTPGGDKEIELRSGVDIKIWPPNGAYQTFTLADMGLTGTIVEAYSDEDEDAPGTADGATLNDIVIAGDCLSVQVRKERVNNGNGRVYTVIDNSNVEYKIGVPRWPWGWFSNPIDDGNVYSETCP